MANAIQFNGAQKMEITTDPAVTADITVEVTFRITSLPGTTTCIIGNRDSNDNSRPTRAVIGINSSNQIFAAMGTNTSLNYVNGSALSVDTTYLARLVITGLNTTTANTQQGTAELFLDGVSQGTFTPNNDCFQSTFQDMRPFKFLGAGGLNTSVNVPLGDASNPAYIFSARMTGDTYDYIWSSDSSTRTNPGIPTLNDTSVDSNDFTGYVGFDAGSSYWVDVGGGADVTPPVFTATPAVTATTNTGHTISATMDEPGTTPTGGFYGVRLASGSATPTPAQIIAGDDSTDTEAPEAKSVSFTTGAQADLVFSTGSVSTEYDYHVVAVDDAGNAQTLTADNKITATTSAGSIAITGGTLTAGAAFSGTYTGIASLSTPITLTDSQGNTLDVAIVDAGSGNFSGTMPSLPSSGSQASILFGNVTVTGGP